MTPGGLSVVARRLWPRRMRARLAVLYAVLFLLAGAALLALTYALVAHVLLPAPATPLKPDQAPTALARSSRRKLA